VTGSHLHGTQKLLGNPHSPALHSPQPMTSLLFKPADLEPFSYSQPRQQRRTPAEILCHTGASTQFPECERTIGCISILSIPTFQNPGGPSPSIVKWESIVPIGRQSMARVWQATNLLEPAEALVSPVSYCLSVRCDPSRRVRVLGPGFATLRFPISILSFSSFFNFSGITLRVRYCVR
jgi:hypothetical protein